MFNRGLCVLRLTVDTGTWFPSPKSKVAFSRPDSDFFASSCDVEWLPCSCDELSCSETSSYSLAPREHLLAFPFKFTVFQTKQLQTFLTVFSSHCSPYMYGHTVPQANPHACWTYVYADGHICIADSSPFHCSSPPLKCHWYTHCSYSVWHYSCSFASRQNHSSHCQNSWQCLCVLCDVFRMILTDSTSMLLPLWREQGLVV